MTSEKSTVSYREEHIQELFRILGKMTKGAVSYVWAGEYTSANLQSR